MNEPLLRDGERAKLAEAVALVVAIWRDIVRFVVQLLPALIRLSCVAGCAGGLILGTSDAWAAFGGDGAALIPALTLGIVPVLYAFVARVRWGGLLAAGAIALVVGKTLALLPFYLVQISVVIVLAAATFSEMARRPANVNGVKENESTK